MHNITTILYGAKGGKSTSLRKHAYSNILKILPLNNEKFQTKKSDIFHISAQNIDCGYSLEPPRLGGSNEYPQSMFLSRNKENNVYPCKPQFYYIKVGFKGVKIIKACFRDVKTCVSSVKKLKEIIEEKKKKKKKKKKTKSDLKTKSIKTTTVNSLIIMYIPVYPIFTV